MSRHLLCLLPSLRNIASYCFTLWFRSSKTFLPQEEYQSKENRVTNLLKKEQTGFSKENRGSGTKRTCPLHRKKPNALVIINTDVLLNKTQ